ncbi:MAG TPA: hypothetical protein VK171_12355 [Fimbriimonas sp.]|nr:hypothetical protein [Fimbriimonas sp.]
MLSVVQLRLNSLNEWTNAWETPVPVPDLVTDLIERTVETPTESVSSAIHYLAGYLARFDFSLFRNGGQPLIERRTGPVQEEILIRVGKHATAGSYIPISFDLHVNHADLREVRDRYWTAAGRPPTSLVGGNSGLVQAKRTFDIWNVAPSDALAELVKHFREDVLPYFELLASPNQLRRMVFAGEAQLFDPVTSLEWLLMEFGRSDAKEYLRQLLNDEQVTPASFWQEHDIAKSQKFIGVRNGDITQSLAVIAVSHDLCKRWVY